MSNSRQANYYVLWNTLASHSVMNGGNILILQKVLGHRNLKTTMIYTHLSPEHLQQTKTLNPLFRLTVSEIKKGSHCCEPLVLLVPAAGIELAT
ncbi:tyrosine-type recombinase/integrase [Undibacterium sp.]|uniref:tyrosine-type recombinase/integrase n=1 Tax=Undibacterium sp. TaxID=1914977 RepID=UPI0032C21CDF